MNYFAHLFLAQPNAESCFGNLLGDFRKNVNVHALPEAVQKGLENHYLVGRYTDAHPLTISSKQLFSKQRRRFAGIAIDVLYDHFLIKHWATYSTQSLDSFKQGVFNHLLAQHQYMPERMQNTVSHMVKHDWFAQYESLTGIERALDNIAKRIRFKNSFHGAMQEIEPVLSQLEAHFLHFFPELLDHVKQNAIEQLSTNTVNTESVID